MTSKFTMVDPTQGEDLHHIMAQTVNDRMGKAVEELQEKHDKRAASGKPAEQDDPSVDGPTGSSYRQAEAQERAQQQKSAARSRKAEERAVAAAREEEIVQQLQEANLLSDEEDDEDDDENGLDAEFKLIREKRMAQLKAQHQEKAENLSKGHGQYREISQDEFLPEVTGSRHVLVHFYHKDFMRCKIMDKHLAILAPAHLECKFLKINAEKAPFFVGKLQVKILPTVIYFKESIAEERVQGFEGLTEAQPKGAEDEFPTTVLATRLAKLGAIEYTAPPTLEELRRFQLGKTMGAIRSGGKDVCLYDDDEDLEGDISD